MDFSRRDFLKMSAAGALGASASGWFDVLASRAAEARRQGVKHKSCILLWMAGGPAQSHTFDLKNSPYKAIDTAVEGIKISEHLPKLASEMKDMILLRSMSTGDGNHNTATYLMHTGFRKGAGGLTHPSLGAMVAHELGQPDFELPNFVAIGGAPGSGFLGPKYSPVILNGTDFAGLPDLKPAVPQKMLDEQASLLEELDRSFSQDYQAASINAHKTTYQRALDLMKSSKTRAFNLSDEPAKLREAYGRGRFGQGCLLARRLIEAGVPFVEVTLGGWDTHNNAVARCRQLSNELDPAMATLIADLRYKGLLKDTLIIWMGEFGRSQGDGSNHYARCWTSVLAGGGLKTGQVVGDSGDKGQAPTKRPISCPDFMATICKALGIDWTKNYTVRGRPLQKVDKAAKPIEEIF